MSILRVTRQEVCDKIVGLIIRYRTLGMHMNAMKKMSHIFNIAGPGASDEVLEEFEPSLQALFFQYIYRYCSIEVATQVIETSWTRLGEVAESDANKNPETKEQSKFSQKSSQPTFSFTQLLFLCLDSQNQTKMDKINQVHHFKNYQKKTADLAMRQFEDACHFPDQLSLIAESLEKTDLANDIAGRLGIELESYIEICTAALAHSEQLKPRQEIRYAYNEIGSAASGAMKKSDNFARSTK